MKLFGTIEKVEEREDGTVVVSGIASSEAVDCEGEVVLASAMRAALPEYLRYPAIRESHDPTKAAGTALTVEVGADGVTRLEAHIVDPVAVLKVKTKTYAGFSIGGRVPPGGRDPTNPKVIRALTLTEISLVDRPANPAARIELFKADAATDATWPNPERTEATVQVDAPNAPATVEEPAHRCPVCQSGLTCPTCTAGVTAAKVEKMAGSFAADTIAKAHRERDEAVAKVVHLEGERDDLRKALDDARREIAANPKGAVRVMPRAVSKGDDTADYQAAESVAPETALEAIRKAHLRPVPMRVKGD